MSESENIAGMNGPDKAIVNELQDLENEYVDAKDIKLRPGQCYRITRDPFRILYNTNCPETLKIKIESILSRYIIDK